MKEIITLDHGSGGLRTSQLIEEILLPALRNPALENLGDGALLPNSGEQLVFSTDSFVVTPWKFPGGDIGKLAVCGTVNDISMAGGLPRFLSLSFLLEEGFPLESFREIVDSIAQTARQAGVFIVTGDTKVVERGKGDGVYINTAGLGFQRAAGLGRGSIRLGDKILVSGSVGCHGAAVMMARGGLPCEGAILSDCRPLHRLAGEVLKAGGVRMMRDPTRGGVATALNEFVEKSAFSIELEEDAIPVEPAVATACEILGLDPLYSACEGRMLAAVDPAAADAVLQAMRREPGGEQAACIGSVTREKPGKVILRTALGGGRLLGKLAGAQLPRIC